ncbi:ABC transporter substrate-binding protein [Rhodopila sp.]|uniref:ABC transporter substrate-binding protein n=1 Tax=Rhodopila sp. TaxID=2480087 RepID=UPI003D0E0282
MTTISRRHLLAASAATLGVPAIASAQGAAKPRLTAISQWSSGSDGAAISALGKVFEEHGGIWQHNPVPGFTTDMMNKLRAQILAGDPPAISQLKGPEIAAWSKIAPTVDISPWVKAAGWGDKVPAELAKSCQPAGEWIAVPLQVYRINTLFLSAKGMQRAGLSKPPATWAEFNEAAEKMKAAGMTPVANGGIRWDDGMKFEIALAGISPDIYRRAIMELDSDALNSKEVLAAFQQLRKIANWMNPNIAAQNWQVNIPAFVKGDMGMVLMGGWAQGNLMRAGATTADFTSGSAPQENGPPCFDLNADCFIFWRQKAADLQAGQKLFADVVMQPSTQAMYSKITGSIPARVDVDLSGHDFTDGQRNAAQNLRDAIGQKRVVLSLAHNMAQPNGITAAMIDVLTDYVHNSAIPAAEGQKRLAAAVESAQ